MKEFHTVVEVKCLIRRNNSRIFFFRFSSTVTSLSRIPCVFIQFLDYPENDQMNSVTSSSSVNFININELCFLLMRPPPHQVVVEIHFHFQLVGLYHSTEGEHGSVNSMWNLGSITISHYLVCQIQTLLPSLLADPSYFSLRSWACQCSGFLFLTSHKITKLWCSSGVWCSEI